MIARADLHVHSKHSNRPTEWVLRQAGAPESFTEPRELYRRCRERGMDFVTISDHDSIAGALEIAHLPGTFLSAEVTAAFPEDGCHIHCLVSGISEGQHAEIQRLRGNLYELRDYLAGEGIVHSVAHPLVRVNGRLSVAHLEKLLVLFPRFEGLNGIHDRRANELLRAIVSRLTPEVLDDLAYRHRLTPLGPRPWEKSLTGGSDDHGGFYLATTWTETPAAATVEGFLGHLRAGASAPGGATGSTLRLTQSLYAIAYEYYRRSFPLFLGGRSDPFARLLASLAGGPPAAAPARRRFVLLGARPRRGDRRSLPRAGGDEPERTTFGFASRAAETALRDLAQGFVRELRRGRLAASAGAAAAQAAPLAIACAPFLVALHAQHRDRDLLDAAAARFLGSAAEEVMGSAGRVAWFADTLADTAADGPADALRALAACGAPHRRALVAIRCGTARHYSGDAGDPGDPGVLGLETASFPPLFTLPLGPGLGELPVPHLLPILDHCERARYAQIVVGTPGPLGLAGLTAGRMLGLRLTGIYPQGLLRRIAATASSDAVLASARLYLRWFYGRMDAVVAEDAAGRGRLLELGLDPARVAVAAPGGAIDAAIDGREPVEPGPRPAPERELALESVA
jgi:hypothetical protein